MKTSPYITLAVTAITLCATLAVGQENMAWITSSIFPGGGGTAAGGPYTFTHTLGESIVGNSVGSNYALTAGFWAGEDGSDSETNVDLQITATLDSQQLAEDDPLFVTLTVSNCGPSAARNVRVKFAVPTGAVLQSVTNEHGSVTVEGSDVTASVMALPSGARFSVETRFSFDPHIFDEIEEFETNLRAQVSSAEMDSDPSNNVAAAIVIVLANRDFADAPDNSIAATYNYPTRRIDNGARHRPVGPYFGPAVAGARDRDPNGMPSVNADGDDVFDANDDEAGITFLDPLTPGAIGVRVQIDSPVGGTLDAWIDFNIDGQWTMGLPEQIFTTWGLAAGVNVYTFNVPAAAVVGQTYARFRVSNLGGLSFTGYANNGEVEDYAVTIDPGGGGDPNPNPLLQVARVPGGIVLNWDNPAAVLEEAASSTGPFTVIPGAASPHRVMIGSAPMKFYRLRVVTRP
jgi:hypothetical protein